MPSVNDYHHQSKKEGKGTETVSNEQELGECFEQLSIDTNSKQHSGPSKTKSHNLSEVAYRMIGRVHTAVVRNYSPAGIIVDVVVYDTSEASPLEHFRSDFYQDLVPSRSTSDEHTDISSYPRYVVPSLTLHWGRFPNTIQNLPENLRLEGTRNFLPPNTIFNVYCDTIGANSEPLLKVANRSAPIIALPNHIIKALSFSKPQKFSPLQQGGRPRFLIIIDFEATCDFAPNPLVRFDTSEIIEFPWVVLDTITGNIVHENRFYIKPDLMDGVTNYCTNLTGITKDQCKKGISLKSAIQKFDTFIREKLFPFGENNFRIVTDSIWDLQVQLREECRRKNIPLEWWYADYFDLREEFRHFYPWFGFLKRNPPLYIMLNAFGLEFIGRHHSGLDDCKSIAQVVKVLLQLHPNTFTQTRKIAPDYDPWTDDSWISFMGNCPSDAWLCTNEKCAVYNKPSYYKCRFCEQPRPSSQN